MIKETKELKSLEQTGEIMGDFAIRFACDMLPYSDYTIFEIQDWIKSIPYREDPPNEEHISRPLYTLNDETVPFDCDDRAVCIGAYCHLKEIPFRFIAVCEAPNTDFHHVYCEIFLNGKYIPCDCTYPHHLVGQEKENVTKRKVIFDSKRVPTLGFGPSFSDIANKAGDIGSWVYRKTGETKDSFIDAPGNIADSFSDSFDAFFDDPLGATYRSSGRFVDNSIDIFKSIGSVSKDLVTLDFDELGRDFAKMSERTGNLLPSGFDDIYDTLTLAPITQDREGMGKAFATVGPIAASYVLPGLSEGLASTTGLSSLSPAMSSVIETGSQGIGAFESAKNLFSDDSDLDNYTTPSSSNALSTPSTSQTKTQTTNAPTNSKSSILPMEPKPKPKTQSQTKTTESSPISGNWYLVALAVLAIGVISYNDKP